MSEEVKQDPWADDLLHRREDAHFLKEFLVARAVERAQAGKGASYVLNLDSGWGHGKTFFLTRFKEQLTQDGYLSVYVNAWKDDHAEDPLLAVMSAVDAVIQSGLVKHSGLRRAWAVTRKSGLDIVVTGVSFAAKKAASKLIGGGVEAISDIIARSEYSSELNVENAEKKAADLTKGVEKLIDKRAEEMLKAYRDAQKSISVFKSNLTKFVSELESAEGTEAP